jgi:hypothetical protein
MPPPGDGFATNVADLEKYATALPLVADALRRPVATLTEHTATLRSMEVGAVSAAKPPKRSSPS